MADQDYYKRLIEQDRQLAPLTDEEEGAVAGEKSYNEMVNPVNKLMKTGEPLRKKLTPEQEARIKADEDAMRKFQAERNPSSEQGIVRDILLGKDVAQVPYLPPINQSSQQVIAPNLPRLSDVSVQQSAQNVSTPRAPTTAPQIITESELASRVKGTSENLDSNIKGAPGFYDVAAQGIEANLKGDEAKALTEAQFLEDQRKKIQDQLDQNQALEAAAREKAEQQISAMGSIDPNRVWNDRSIWSKMALVAGSALAGRGGTGVGLQMMQDLVAKDLEAQRADLEAGIKRNGSLLELLKPYASNRAELMKMGNQVGMKLAEKYAEAMKAKVGQGAIPMLAVEKTMKEYTKPLLAEKNKADENLIKVSGQEEERRNNDNNWLLKNQELQLQKARLKFDSQNMTESDSKRLEGATAMAISAKKMKELEDDKNFDPTAIRNALASYMQGKGIPSSLNEQQAEYLANYINYFVYKKQAITGAAATDREEEKIALLVAPDKTFRKDAIKLYQKQRAQAINGTINSMNPAALLRTKNIPEFREFDINRAKLKDQTQR